MKKQILKTRIALGDDSTVALSEATAADLDRRRAYLESMIALAPKEVANPKERAARGESSATDQGQVDTQIGDVGGSPIDPAPLKQPKPHDAAVRGVSKATKSDARPGPHSSPVLDHAHSEIHEHPVGDESDTGQFPFDHQTKTAGVNPSATTDQTNADSHPKGVGGGGPVEPPPTIVNADPMGKSSGWLELRVWAEMFHDAQEARKAAVNRAERGGVDPEIYADHIARLESVEHGCSLVLRRTFRRVVPSEIVAWQKAERGVGEHLLARLLGHLGDPFVATRHHWLDEAPEGHSCDPLRCGKRHLVVDPPTRRRVGQLWQYCGVGDPARKRRAGMSQEEAFGLGSPICKTLIHLLAEACMKQPDGNLYRDVYTRGRVKYADREDWKPIRQHNAALRLVKKELLRDLWLARHADGGAAA